MLRRAAGPGRARVEGVREDVREVRLLHRVRGIEDALDVRRLPVCGEAGLLEVVLAVVQPTGVETVRDGPDLPLVAHPALHAVGILAPVGPLLRVVVERLDVPGIRELADEVPADVDDVRHIVAVETEEELGVEIIAADLLEVDLHVDPGVLGLQRGSGLLDVFRLEACLVGVGHRDRSGRLARGRRGPAPGGRRAAGDDHTRSGRDLQETPARDGQTLDLAHTLSFAPPAARSCAHGGRRAEP